MRFAIFVSLAALLVSSSADEPELVKDLPRNYEAVELKVAAGVITFSFDGDSQLIDLPAQSETLELPELFYVKQCVLNERRDELLCLVLERRKTGGADYHSVLKLTRTAPVEWEAKYIFMREQLMAGEPERCWIESISEYDSKTGQVVLGVARYEADKSDAETISVERGWEVWDTKKERKVKTLVKARKSLSFHRSVAPKLPKPRKIDKTKSEEEPKPRTAAELEVKDAATSERSP